MEITPYIDNILGSNFIFYFVATRHITWIMILTLHPEALDITTYKLWCNMFSDYIHIRFLNIPTMINKQLAEFCQMKCRYVHAGIVNIIIALIAIVMSLLHDYLLLITILHQS